MVTKTERLILESLDALLLFNKGEDEVDNMFMEGQRNKIREALNPTKQSAEYEKSLEEDKE